MTRKTTTKKAKQAPSKKRVAKRKPAKKLAKPTLVGGKPPKPRTPQISRVGSIATKQDRGTKRTCQSSECGSHFYDLDRTPIACPICGAAYVITSAPAAIVIVRPEEKTPRKPKKKEFADAEANEDETTEEDTLDEVEVDKTVGNDDDETVLQEEDEDGGDVSKILGGTKTEGAGVS
jgi:uncharacterized protein (TIGR02300 family)